MKSLVHNNTILHDVVRKELKIMFRIPALLIVAVALSLYGYRSSAQAPATLNSGDTIRFREHIVVLSKPALDTIGREGGQPILVQRDRTPQNVDGDTIYSYLPQGPVSKDGPNWQDALFLWLRRDLSRLDDGQYSLRVPDIVIDRKGRVAHYGRLALLQELTDHRGYRPVDSTFRDSLNREMEDFLNTFEFLPALHEGRPAATVIHFHHTVFVKDHQAVMTRQ